MRGWGGGLGDLGGPESEPALCVCVRGGGTWGEQNPNQHKAVGWVLELDEHAVLAAAKQNTVSAFLTRDSDQTACPLVPFRWTSDYQKAVPSLAHHRYCTHTHTPRSALQGAYYGLALIIYVTEIHAAMAFPAAMACTAFYRLARGDCARKGGGTTGPVAHESHQRSRRSGAGTDVNFAVQLASSLAAWPPQVHLDHNTLQWPSTIRSSRMYLPHKVEC